MMMMIIIIIIEDEGSRDGRATLGEAHASGSFVESSPWPPHLKLSSQFRARVVVLDHRNLVFERVDCRVDQDREIVVVGVPLQCRVAFRDRLHLLQIKHQGREARILCAAVRAAHCAE